MWFPFVALHTSDQYSSSYHTWRRQGVTLNSDTDPLLEVFNATNRNIAWHRPRDKNLKVWGPTIMEAMPSIHSFLYITVGRFYPENHNSSVMEEPSVERRHRSYLWHCIQGPTSRFCKEKQPHHPIKCIGTPNIHFEVVTLTHKVGMW